MSTLESALERVPGLLLDVKEPLKSFKRKTFGDAFHAYYREHLGLYQDLDGIYQEAQDKEDVVVQFSRALADCAQEKMEGLPKKNQRENALIDFNFALAVYVIPAIREYQGEVSEPLVQQLLKDWKLRFPKTNVQASTFDEINQGFKHKWCYITTAVCEIFGKPDDCYELTLFRNYRDTYLINQPDGEAAIEEYYDLAPSILKHINKSPDPRAVYQSIWDNYLGQCIHLIEEGEEEACKDLYIKMVRKLQEEYFIS